MNNNKTSQPSNNTNPNFSIPKSKDDLAHKNDSTNLDPKHQKPKNQDRSKSTPDNSATPESDD